MLAALEKKAEAFNKASHSLIVQNWDLSVHLLLRESRVWEEGKTAPSHRAAGMVRTLARCNLQPAWTKLCWPGFYVGSWLRGFSILIGQMDPGYKSNGRMQWLETILNSVCYNKDEFRLLLDLRGIRGKNIPL